MKVLITGVCGFIGSHLARRLLSEGHQVRGLSLPGESAKELEALGMEMRAGDITRPESIRGLCDGMDTVFHLAGRVTYWGPRRLFFSSILEGTRNLLDEATDKDLRFVYASSVCAIGTDRHLEGHREEDPVRKTGIPYADAKQEAEKLLWDYHQRGAVRGTVFRPTNVIGPGSVWVKDMVNNLLQGKVPLIDGGRHSASLVGIDNLVEGIVLAGTLDAGIGQTFHFRDDWEVNWKRYLTDLGEMVGKKPSASIPFWLAWPLAFIFDKTLSQMNIKPPATRHIVGLLGRNLDIDNTKAKQVLGWRTKVTYEETMSKIREWVQSQMCAKGDSL